MPLKHILADVASEIGLSLNSDDEKNFLIARINDAAKEVYESTDLTGSVFEQLFSYDQALQQVSLPWYVGKVRAARWNISRHPVTTQDMRPRYQSNGWQGAYFNLRERGRRATSRNISNASILELTIPAPETEDFSVIITGPTANSGRISETVTFLASETDKWTTNSFIPEIESIQNALPHLYDVTVLDVDGQEMAVLPNHHQRTAYLICTLQDPDVIGGGSRSLIEVLYKRVFSPFEHDYDEFVVEGYDKAIAWKTIEHLRARGQASAIEAHAKALQVVIQQQKDGTQGTQKFVDFLADPFAAPLSPQNWNRYRYRGRAQRSFRSQ